ncbi:MAG: hypothetical protein MZV70_69995 [Desulfobacterales bacterium]|nr:hypothetical protein [Desulfobacterales bacterium]
MPAQRLSRLNAVAQNSFIPNSSNMDYLDYYSTILPRSNQYLFNSNSSWTNEDIYTQNPNQTGLLPDTGIIGLLKNLALIFLGVPQQNNCNNPYYSSYPQELL